MLLTASIAAGCLLSPSNAFQGIKLSAPLSPALLSHRVEEPSSTRTRRISSTSLSLSSNTSPQQHPELERTVAHLKKLTTPKPNALDPLKNERDRRYRNYLQQPANALKRLLNERGLPQKGRKPDLANRLAQNDMDQLYGTQDIVEKSSQTKMVDPNEDGAARASMRTFAGLPISQQAADVLSTFQNPSPIQEAAFEHVMNSKKHSDCILHAATGSGKTIAYLLPVTEALWDSMRGRGQDDDDWVAFVITPTRELAAQVAAVAQRLAPAQTVHHVTHPLNLVRIENDGYPIRLYVGSAKAIHQSLYGDGSGMAPPTPKPAAMRLLQDTRYLILDEVDRLLLQQQKNKKSKQHERPAAIVTAAIVRLTLGSATVVAASATAGRPVRRELARCMGLPPQEGPVLVRATAAQSRAVDVVPIPDTISHFFVDAQDDASPGALLTMAYGKVLRPLAEKEKVLLVLPRNFGISTTNVIGALQHFGARVSTEEFDNILVSTEDGIRGMDWNVDDVVLVGRPMTPADYTHICGRTGRAGKTGRIITVGNLRQWESMLNIRFQEWKGEE